MRYRDDDIGDVMPSHIGMFLFIGISTTCGYDWEKQEGKEEFSDILQRCTQMQHQKLINNGLTGKFNSNIAKLALGKHGYHDKQDVDLKSKMEVTFNMGFQGDNPSE